MRFMARGNWSLGGLTITADGIETGVGRVPAPFESWEQLERVVMNHVDFGNLIFLVPTQTEVAAAVKEQALMDGGHGDYVCKWCRRAFLTAEELTVHESGCPVLLAAKEEVMRQMLLEMGQAVEDMPVDGALPIIAPVEGGANVEDEQAAIAEQERIRKEQADAEEAEIVARRAKQNELAEKIAKGKAAKAKGGGKTGSRSKK